MKRIVLIHWNSDEAEERAGALRAAGYDVSCHTDSRANPRSLREDPPDAYVIDLRRIPSQGREIGGWLRRQKTTRHVPLVFIEGDPEKTDRARALLPDATFSPWDSIVGALGDAAATPVENPIVPGTMDAYAGVPLGKKLGIREGASIALVGAPEGFEERIEGLPSGATFVDESADGADVILLFVTSLAALDSEFATTAARLAGGGRLWICWPKKASGVESDLSETGVRAYGLERSFIDYKIASIDETWSGLCFARRKS